MLIEEYFVHLERMFASCPHVIQTTLTKERRAPHIGFIQGAILFSQGIELFLMEFVRTQPRLIKSKYRYHCQDAKGQLLFRYDDAPHHRVSTFPHHKHVRTGSEGETIVASLSPSLERLVNEVADLVKQARRNS